MRARLLVRGLLTVASLALVEGCGDGFTATPDAGSEAISLQIVSGGGQSGPPGAELPLPIVVRVMNASGTTPVSGMPVNFVVTAGGGTFYAGTGISDANGYASDYWTLGSSLGTQRAEARAVTGPTGSRQVFGTFVATAVSTAATGLAFTTQPPNGTTGTGFGAVVTARDAQGNTATGFSGNVTVAITSGTGTTGAVLGGTLTRAAVNGVATFTNLTIDRAGSGYTLTATSSGLAAATSAAFTVAAPAVGAHTYTTNFPLTENPISEGGRWINGGTVGLDWGNVRTAGGLAYGANLPQTYADPTAILSGAWLSDQSVQGTVYWGNPTLAAGPAVELHLRMTVGAHSITGYECTFGRSSTDTYLLIVRWNGALGNFTILLNTHHASNYAVVTGDVVKATIVGSTIRVYRNGVLMGQATDNTFTGGSPGIGFGSVENTYGFRSFTATDSVIP